jgi:flagellar biogenesis protein FliO
MSRQATVFLLVFLCSSSAYAVPPPLPMPDYGSTLLRLAVVLVGVCLLAWVSLRWGFKRYQPTTDGPVRVRARIPVEPRRTILLLEIGEKVFVVASTEHGMQSLGQMQTCDVPEVEPTPVVSFADTLKRLRPTQEEV